MSEFRVHFSRSGRQGQKLHNSDVEADVALSRCAPSEPRSLTPVVVQPAQEKMAKDC